VVPLSLRRGEYGGGGFKLWRVVVNILNKRLRSAVKISASLWGFDVRLTTPRYEKMSCLEMLHRISDLNESFGKQNK
jgi:hypothetical protein